MKRFTATCIDNKTGLEVITCECSYNNACYYLERFCKIDFNDSTTKIEVDYQNNLTWIETKYRLFAYDETRGYLLGE